MKPNTFRPEQILAIREACAAGTKMKALAIDHQVSMTTILHICTGRTYRAMGGPTYQPRHYETLQRRRARRAVIA